MCVCVRVFSVPYEVKARRAESCLIHLGRQMETQVCVFLQRACVLVNPRAFDMPVSQVCARFTFFPFIFAQLESRFNSDVKK